MIVVRGILDRGAEDLDSDIYLSRSRPRQGTVMPTGEKWWLENVICISPPRRHFLASSGLVLIFTT